MRKFISVLLAAMMLLGLASFAQAEDVEIVLYHNKVEIQNALTEYVAKYSEMTDGVNVTAIAVGGGQDYHASLKSENQSGKMPDIFVIEGIGNYEVWKEYIEDLSDQPWVADTDVAYIAPDTGAVVGFPVAIEGYGLGYNAAILEKAGVDPASMSNIDGVRAAFEAIDAMKEELGLDAVVSMGASVAGGLNWVSGQHNFAIYLGGGLDYDDTAIIDLFRAGEVDADRLAQYAEYVKLIFDYSDQDILVNGNYDAQLGSFVNQKTAFIHQGNWIDPNLAELGLDFEIGYAPHGFSTEDTPGLYLFAPSYYVVNNQSPNKEAAKAFLAAMASTDEGADYMVNQAGMVPAFKSITLEPAGQLSQELVKANAVGGNYSVRFGEMPDGYGMNVLAPIFELLAQGAIDEAQFCEMIAAEIATAYE